MFTYIKPKIGKKKNKSDAREGTYQSIIKSIIMLQQNDNSHSGQKCNFIEIIQNYNTLL